MTTIERVYEQFVRVPRVTTDSRTCEEGSIFFALKGATFDGNTFARACIDKGCAMAVVDDPAVVAEGDGRFVLVDDVLATLQLLARYHRRRLGTTILGITGTNGKTTTKELTAAVLSRRFNLLYTQGNLNNHIGVPLTLLRLSREHELAVVEMGASHPGDIRELVEIAEPDYGIITNVGKAHLQGFGSFEGVMRTKGELYDFLRAHGGKAFVNQHDPLLADMAEGLERIDYVEGRQVDGSPLLTVEWEGHEVKTHLIGGYNLDNVLAAATIGRHFGVSADDVCAALADYVPSNNRSQLVVTPHNRLIVDAYNANPTSMSLALRNFAQMQAEPKLCILGMMGELGSYSHDEHQHIVDLLHELGLTHVWLVGTAFADTRHPDAFRLFDDVAQVKDYLAAHRPEGHTILVKGSNSTKLFQLPEVL